MLGCTADCATSSLCRSVVEMADQFAIRPPGFGHSKWLTIYTMVGNVNYITNVIGWGNSRELRDSAIAVRVFL